MNQNVFIVEATDRHVSGTLAVVAPTNIVASPGQNYRIVVTSFSVQNESQNATVILLQDGGQTRWRVYASGPGNGLAMSFPANHPWKLRKNQPLVMDLDGANTCNYNVQYYVERA